MDLRTALRLIRSASYSADRKVSLICSFEPLHFRTYLSALLVERFSDAAPEVVTFGYDQLEGGLKETASSMRVHPAVVLLSWEDIHPQLTWRSRGPFEIQALEEILSRGEQLSEKLERWLSLRKGAESYFVMAPVTWLPFGDPVFPQAMGKYALSAKYAAAQLLLNVANHDGRVLSLPIYDLNYRELLSCGCPFTLEDSERAARRCTEVIFESQLRKKALIVDLDRTVWRGIIAEDGLDGIECRPEGGGYPYYVFQKFMSKLKSEGVMLGFCSRNNPQEILPVFDRLQMPLTLDDFAAYRCNWQPKSQNIQAIARELNVGLESIVYVDDDPAELAAIGRDCPLVELRRTPQSGAEWHRLMSGLQQLFFTWRISDEDLQRHEGLRAARLRAASLRVEEDPFVSSSSFTHLKDLNLEMTVNSQAFTDPRSLELINKTNQFNLTGERFSTSEWLVWQERPKTFCFSVRLTDRFGDFGTIAVLTGILDSPGSADVRQVVVSCRALGRGVAEVLLWQTIRAFSLRVLTGRFKDTGRNVPARECLNRLGCVWSGTDKWSVQTESIEVKGEEVKREAAVVIRVE